MKYIILLPVLFLVACGSDSDSASTSSDNLYQQCETGTVNSLGNTWVDQENNELLLRSDCSGYSNDACGHVFTYYQPVNGRMLVDVERSNNVQGCLPDGETVCAVTHLDPNGSNEELRINCGLGTVIYFAEGTL